MITTEEQREAARERSRRWYAANRERALERDRRRYAANREMFKERARRYRQANIEVARARGRERTKADPEGRRRRVERYRASLRTKVFDHYGRSCACCGSARSLQIDHVNGGGSQHRIELFGKPKADSRKMYRWLIENGFPEGFQTLCIRCNSSKKDGPACRINHRKAA